jgi:hypothetical protein
VLVSIDEDRFCSSRSFVSEFPTNRENLISDPRVELTLTWTGEDYLASFTYSVLGRTRTSWRPAEIFSIELEMEQHAQHIVLEQQLRCRFSAWQALRQEIIFTSTAAAEDLKIQ